MAAVAHRAVRSLMTQDRLIVLMFPGLDGTGHMFARVLAELPETFAPRVIEYPTDRALGYDELVSYAEAFVPRGHRFAMLGESFSGPLVLQIAAKQPPGLVAVVLVASFHRSPISRLLARLLRPLAGVLFSRPPPAFVARHLLAGADAPRELVAELRKGRTRESRQAFDKTASPAPLRDMGRRAPWSPVVAWAQTDPGVGAGPSCRM